MRTPIILSAVLGILSIRLVLQIAWAQAGPTGRVLAASGAPIPGARIFYSRDTGYALLPPGTNGRRQRWVPAEPPVSGVVSTAANGTFTLPKVPDGSYKICIVSPGPGFLDTCSWTGAIAFSIVQGNAPAISTLRLTAGTEVHIRVNDALQLAAAAKNRPASLILGVIEKGHIFHAAPVVSQDQNGRDHSITVPSGTPLKLWLFSRTLRIKDAAANDVDTAGYNLPLQAAAGTPRIDYVLNVTGPK